MNTTEFHYTTYIKSTPQQVWEALTNPEFTKQYWGHAVKSDWKPGSRWELCNETGPANIIGIVRESVPPTRLVVSWSAPEEKDDSSKQSRVTYEITTYTDEIVRLDVAHEQLEAGSQMAKSVTSGWPRVLSSLKSFIETGAVLNVSCDSKAG